MIRRRPLCLLCCVQVVLILLLHLAGVPFYTEPPDLEKVRTLIETPRSYRVEGLAEKEQESEDYRTLTVRKAVLVFDSEVYSVGTVKCTWSGETFQGMNIAWNMSDSDKASEGEEDVAEQDAKTGSTEKSEIPDKTGTIRTAGTTGNTGKAGKTEKAEKAEKTEKTEKTEKEEITLSPGMTVALYGTVKETAPAENPGQFDAQAWYALQGIYFRMSDPELTVLNTKTDSLRCGMERARAGAAERIRSVYPEDVSGILNAMLTGDRSDLEEDTKNLWRTGGLVHMLSISGLHLTFLGMGLFRLLQYFTIRAFRKVRELKNPLIPAALVSSCSMIIYTVFTGAGIPTVRALIMFLTLCGGKVARRTYDPPTALAAAVSLILLANPMYLFSSGFLLSVSAVLCTLIFGKRSRGMTALFLYLWMLPIISYFYFEIPTLSIPANLLAVPLLPVILGVGIAGCIVRPLSFPAVFLVRGISLLLEKVSEIPYSSVIIGRPHWWNIVLFYAALAAWTARITKIRRSKRRFLYLPMAPLLVVLLALRLPGTLKMTVLSVGQGDSICLELPSGSNVLVDGGSSSVPDVGTNRILPFLKHEGIQTLDYAVVTHMDDDHCNGIAELLKLVRDKKTTMKVGAVVLPYLSQKDEKYMEMEELAETAGARVLRVAAGDSFKLGDTELDVYNPVPENETLPVDSNMQCVVIGVHHGNFDALLTGDVCGDAENRLLETLRRERKESGIHYEVLKAAHHGSRYSTPEEFLEFLDPEVSIISAGTGNHYGHPHRELLERLEKCGTDVERTDEAGAVTVTVRGPRFAVRKFRK